MNLRIGRYRLLKRLALGGMAEIWLARQGGAQGFEKLVVIKRILPHLAENPEFVQMFLDEARLVAHLTHPNIAQIYDLGHEDGSYFIAMEHVHGENLRTVLKRREALGAAALPAPLVARIGAFCCQALAYAHVATDGGGRPLNVVHRDVSPQNLLLGYDGQVKVVDFGIAKAATQVAETRTGVLKGKFAYMSPEHCRGDPLDGRSDLFALGVVLWELLSGQRLYSRKTDMQTFLAICEEPPPPLAQVGIAAPDALEAVIHRALEKDRDARFGDGYEMADALERYLRETDAPVTQRQLATEMTRLFEDRIAAWQALLQGDTDKVDEALMAGSSDLFQPGTPSRSVRPEAPSRSDPTAVRPASSPDPAGPAGPVVEVDVGAPTAVAAPGRPPSGGNASAPSAPRSRRGLLVGVLGGVAVAVVAGVLLAPGHGAGAPAHVRTPPAPVARPAPAPVAKPPPAPVAKPAPAPVAKPAPAPGHLSLDARPWCRVTLDGHVLGTTPLAGVAVSPGTHHLVCAGPGGAEQRLTIHVAPGQRVRRRVTFEPGHLAFRVKPWGRVTLDGHDLGITPLPARAVPPGRHRVVVANEKLGARRTLEVQVGAGKTRVVSVDLRN